jgi:hypothetical protein
LGDLRRFPADDGHPEGLTCIPPCIHCAATPDTDQVEESEMDRIAIDHFLDTLAEVALAVSARRAARRSNSEEESLT